MFAVIMSQRLSFHFISPGPASQKNTIGLITKNRLLLFFWPKNRIFCHEILKRKQVPLEFIQKNFFAFKFPQKMMVPKTRYYCFSDQSIFLTVISDLFFKQLYFSSPKQFIYNSFLAIFSVFYDENSDRRKPCLEMSSYI